MTLYVVLLMLVLGLWVIYKRLSLRRPVAVEAGDTLQVASGVDYGGESGVLNCSAADITFAEQKIPVDATDESPDDSDHSGDTVPSDQRTPVDATDESSNDSGYAGDMVPSEQLFEVRVTSYRRKRRNNHRCRRRKPFVKVLGTVLAPSAEKALELAQDAYAPARAQNNLRVRPVAA